jgi:hypothetical protein
MIEEVSTYSSNNCLMAFHHDFARQTGLLIANEKRQKLNHYLSVRLGPDRDNPRQGLWQHHGW